MSKSAMSKSAMLQPTPQQLEAMLLKAKQAFNNSYSPYSNFKVGACILTDSQQLYAGCNVENAAYPCTQCAEGSAISAMVSAGHNNIQAILIMADYHSVDDICAPCGACRQKIWEFSSKNTYVYLANTLKIYQTLTMADLLPYSFSKSQLI